MIIQHKSGKYDFAEVANIEPIFIFREAVAMHPLSTKFNVCALGPFFFEYLINDIIFVRLLSKRHTH